VSSRLLRAVARRVIQAEGLVGRLRLDVQILDDAGLRAVNREHRGIDAATDVLSFPLLDELQQGGREFAIPPDEPRLLGDVLISFERAVLQAAEFGHSVERELCYLLAHGVLHLLGYDHVAEDERLQMRKREEAALQPLGLAR
jgi:probable rRNA maturation factor